MSDPTSPSPLPPATSGDRAHTPRSPYPRLFGWGSSSPSSSAPAPSASSAPAPPYTSSSSAAPSPTALAGSSVDAQAQGIFSDAQSQSQNSVSDAHSQSQNSVSDAQVQGLDVGPHPSVQEQRAAQAQARAGRQAANASDVLAPEDYRRLQMRALRQGFLNGIIGGGMAAFVVHQFFRRVYTVTPNTLFMTFFGTSSVFIWATSRRVIQDEVDAARARASTASIASLSASETGKPTAASGLDAHLGLRAGPISGNQRPGEPQG